MLIQINMQKKVWRSQYTNKINTYMYIGLFCYVDKANQQIKLLGKLLKKQSVNTVTIGVFISVMCSCILLLGAPPVVLFSKN